jgi:uncharacterized membrane protein
MNTKKIIGIVLAVLLILSGVFHFVNPELYFPLTPDFFSKYLQNYLVGGAEIVLGVGVFIPSYRKLALLGISLLMVVFLPVHIWDATQDTPFVGSKLNAYIRIAMQFALIYLPLWARKD